MKPGNIPPPLTCVATLTLLMYWSLMVCASCISACWSLDIRNSLGGGVEISKWAKHNPLPRG